MVDLLVKVHERFQPTGHDEGRGRDVQRARHARGDPSSHRRHEPRIGRQLRT